MPILEVEVVGTPEGAKNLAQPLADAAGKIIGTGPGHTWLRLRFLPPEQYAENEQASTGVKPAFVSVLLGKLVNMEDRARIASEISKTFGQILNRPTENVHVLFHADAVGRIAFGGRLRTD